MCNRHTHCINIMSKYNDDKYLGFKSGKLTVVGFGYTDTNNFRWICKCSCGETPPKMYSPSKVFLGKTTSCGCNRINARGTKYTNKEYIGKRYNGLEIVGIGEKSDKYSGTMWLCKCINCGKISSFPAKHVVSGRYTSCISTECRRLLKLNNSKYDNKEFIGKTFSQLEVLDIHYDNEADTTSVYWKCRCKLCGNICSLPAHSIISGNNKTCGCTVVSIHEMMLKSIFEKNDIEFREQVSFNDLVGINGGKLRFDFAIIDREGNKKLIEYDGAQHREDPLHSNSTWDIDRVKKHDKLKDDYCSKHGIELVRISKRFKDEDELENYLIKNKII